MPKRADEREEARQASLVPYEELEQNLLTPGNPLIDGAKVVYLGSSTKYSLPLPGKIQVESLDLDEVDADTGQRKQRLMKAVVDDGHTTYDFASHDVYGRQIEVNLMGDEYPQTVRGKRFVIVEHPAHLHFFFRKKGPDGQSPEFKVFLPPGASDVLQPYIAKREARQQEREANYREVGGVVRGAPQPVAV